MQRLRKNKLSQWCSSNKLKLFLYRAASVLGIAATVAFCIYGYKSGLFTSVEAIQRFVAQYGALGPVIFIAIQIIQVVIPIIPGGITLVAGVVIFGPVYGFIYNYIGIVIGSIAAFLMARRLGRRFVENRGSRGLFRKYAAWLENRNRFDKLFAVAIVMPVAPDDFLCMLAGLTKMSLKKFTIIILLCKPPTILVYSMGLTAITSLILGFK